MELEKCGNIIRFWIIKSIEGEVNPPVFVKLLTKQYNIFLSSDLKFSVFCQYDNNISSLFDENRPVASCSRRLMKYLKTKSEGPQTGYIWVGLTSLQTGNLISQSFYLFSFVFRARVVL